MNWNDHSKLVGEHSLLSASQHAWIRYSDDKFLAWVKNQQAKELGTRLHALACEHIELGIPMPKSRKTLYMYVNDAIGYRMQPEQVLFYSEYAFGTADAISFRKEPRVSKEKEILRIHDLKTGVNKASFEQLDVYAAYFCLEYDVDPKSIIIEERIYQNDEVRISEPEVDNIYMIMDIIRHFDQMLREEADYIG